MRWYEICKESADLGAATVSHQFASHHSPNENRYVFTVPLSKGASVTIFCEVSAATLDIVDIHVGGADEHPDAFDTTHTGWYSLGIRIGAGETRRVLRYVIDRVRQDHPAIKRLSGERLTGARHKSGKRVLNIEIP